MSGLADKHHILVVGTGQIAPGIALSFALSNYDVVIAGRREEAVRNACSEIEDGASFMQRHGLIDDETAMRAQARVIGSVGFENPARDASYVVEAVSEDLELKRSVFASLEEHAALDSLLTSTTSALSPTAIQEGMTHPGRFVVTHYAQPAHLMPVVEVVPGEHTAHETVETACELLRRCGIRPVRCADIPGFLFSRLQSAMLREAVALVDRGLASAEDIDAILKYGYAARLPAMGPFEHADLGGIDLIKKVAETVWPDLDCAPTPSGGILDKLCDEGRVGMRSGAGFYDWETRDPVQFKADRDEQIVHHLRSRAVVRALET